jgi:hypothetical protein
VAFVLCWLPFCLLYVYSVSIIIVNNTLINWYFSLFSK